MEPGNWAEWAGAAANVLVAAVAVGIVPFQNWLERRRATAQTSIHSLTAVVSASSALRVIADLQEHLYDLVRTPIGGMIGRDFPLELRIATHVVQESLRPQIVDPALLQNLATVAACLNVARDAVALEPTDGLRMLQGSTQRRQSIEASLQKMAPQFLAQAGGSSRAP